jgi:hypothetical protein
MLGRFNLTDSSKREKKVGHSASAVLGQISLQVERGDSGTHPAKKTAGSSRNGTAG